MSKWVFPQKSNYIKEIFGTDKAVIGMIHLKALPGSPNYKGETIESIVDFGLQDLKAFEEAGVDGFIVENAWDMPFQKPDDIGHESVAAMSVVASKLKSATNLPIGVNFLSNGAIPALAVCKANEFPFIRVNQWVNAYVANEGIIEGQSAKALRYRSQIKGDDIKVFADVHVKHGSHSIVGDRSLQDQTYDNIFFDADVLIATGNRTGDETEISEIEGIKRNTELPVIVGSGMNIDNVEKILSVADGCIVGSSLKQDGLWWNPVDVERSRAFMEKVKQLRVKEGVKHG